MSYDHIALIYNPNSTGDAPRLAKRIQRGLAKVNHLAELTPTDYAGHAEDLAYQLASTHERPLIISVSGDGGYHEVINGVMRAKQTDPKLRPVVSVAAAGNANDHRRVVRDKPIADIIDRHQPQPIDLIKLTVETPGKRLERYAHSYIGFGITPEVAVELNRHSLNPLKELSIVLKAFSRYQKFTIEQDGTRRDIDSLIFANINEMAKVIKLHHAPNLTDNQFEVIEFPHTGRLRLLWQLAKAAIWGLRHQPSHQRYAFRTLSAQSVQSDGEIERLNERANVVIESVPGAVDSLF